METLPYVLVTVRFLPFGVSFEEIERRAPGRYGEMQSHKEGEIPEQCDCLAKRDSVWRISTLEMTVTVTQSLNTECNLPRRRPVVRKPVNQAGIWDPFVESAINFRALTDPPSGSTYQTSCPRL